MKLLSTNVNDQTQIVNHIKSSIRSQIDNEVAR